jgi:hypothetical protein
VEILSVTAELEAAWDEFVGRARNTHFMFQRRYMTYHADRFTDASLVARRKGRIVAALPANRAGDTIHSHQGLTFGGLLVDEADTPEILDALDGCAATWRAAGARRLVYKPIPWIYHLRPAEADLYWLFLHEAQLVRRELTSTIDLTRRGPTSAQRTRGAARAAQAGLVFRRSEAYPAYWELLHQVLESRHGTQPVHTVEEIRQLAASFPQNISLHVAEDDVGVIHAGVVLFRAGQVAHAQYIAVGPEGRTTGALDGLFHHLIAAASGGLRFFDFGISNEGDGRTLNAGLISQKEGFGASALAHDRYEVVFDG